MNKIIKGIKNFWKWRKIIWNDRDYDYIFIFRILHFKLSNINERWKNEDYFVGQEKQRKNLETCVNLLDRIINNTPYDKILDKHFEKWVYPNIWETDSLGLEDFKPKVICEQERKEIKNIFQKQEILYKQDLEYLFKLLRRHISKWWD